MNLIGDKLSVCVSVRKLINAALRRFEGLYTHIVCDYTKRRYRQGNKGVFL